MVASNSIIMNSNDTSDLDYVQAAATEFKKKYEIKERLGKGLSSVVYVCMDKTSGKEYAVKVMDVSEEHINADGMNIIDNSTLHEDTIAGWRVNRATTRPGSRLMGPGTPDLTDGQ